jgi:hypothetical protein
MIIDAACRASSISSEENPGQPDIPVLVEAKTAQARQGNVPESSANDYSMVAKFSHWEHLAYMLFLQLNLAVGQTYLTCLSISLTRKYRKPANMDSSFLFHFTFAMFTVII